MYALGTQQFMELVYKQAQADIRNYTSTEQLPPDALLFLTIWSTAQYYCHIQYLLLMNFTFISILKYGFK